MEVKDKVIIVTGASQGIGLSTARLLSEKGAKVVLAARSKEVIKKLEAELPESFAIVTDLRKEEDIKKMVDSVIKKYKKIDILINNAGQGIRGFSVEKTDIKSYKEIMELNVYSVVRAMQEVIPHMRKQGGGMILNVSSKVTKMHIPYLGAYSSTKYALNSLSLTAREELKKENIIVSLVIPGLTDTNFSKNAIANPNDNWNARMASSDRPIPIADSAQKVAQTILDAINSEQAEVEVK